MQEALATRFVQHLRLELDAIIDRTLAIANAATFRHDEQRGRRVTMLALTDDQRARADENQARLVRWEAALVSFLRRHGIAGDTEIGLVVSDLTQCVTFRWQDRDDVSERQWRTRLHRELLRLSADARRPLSTCATERERGLPYQPEPFSPFPLRIEALGAGRWRISAGELATECVCASSITFEAPPPDGIERFGRNLFDVVFAGSVGEAFRHSRARGKLRIQLDTRQAGALHPVRWELLHDGEQFLTLSGDVSLARWFGEAANPPPTAVPPLPLRLLAMASTTPDVPLLGSRHELAALEAALAPLAMLGLLEIDVVSGSSLTALRHRLRSAANAGRPYHVWHFIGHGEDDALIMTDDAGEHRPVRGAELKAVFGEHPSLALVVLNSCHGIRFHDDGTTSGIAVSFLRCGAPAVLAMQEEISDPAAILLAEELYGALSDGANLDTALIETRRAIFFQPSPDWHIPVLLTAAE